jgi:hypothetical protein
MDKKRTRDGGAKTSKGRPPDRTAAARQARTTETRRRAGYQRLCVWITAPLARRIDNAKRAGEKKEDTVARLLEAGIEQDEEPEDDGSGTRKSRSSDSGAPSTTPP